ncbi:MAG: hypothetical protein E6K02_11080 [Methanobacteriota archaeon]|nr:MAG: hypothetical protein E6K02_11080 [Euryarchaeota archaeon]
MAIGAVTYVPVIVVVVLAVTVAVCAAGVTYPGTAPNETVYVPGGIDCHIPQSSRGIPFTKIVPATAGLVVTRSEPCTTNCPTTVVVAPAATVTVVGAGAVTP